MQCIMHLIAKLARSIVVIAKGASPKEKTAKIWTYVKFSLPYLPSKPIWTEKNMDMGLIFLPTYLPKKYGHV